MSIATEITDLNNNLTDAKNAVTAKGGTVGDTGLAGLASEIATIPSGGSTPSEWCRFWYHPFEFSWTYDSGSSYNVSSVSIDQSRFVSCFEQYVPSSITQVTFECNDDIWQSPDIPDMTWDTTSLEGEWGISLTIDDPSDTSFFMVMIGYSQNNQETMCIELSQSVYENLVTTTYYGNAATDLGSMKIDNRAITKVEIGSEVTSTPIQFLAEAIYMTEIDLSHADSLTTIGAFFMASCYSFNQDITLPQTITSIGDSFMRNCRSMVSTVNVGSLNPNTVIGNVNEYIFGMYNSTDPAYTTGITIAGTTASAWLTKLPNSDTRPYRKLILGD